LLQNCANVSVQVSHSCTWAECSSGTALSVYWSLCVWYPSSSSLYWRINCDGLPRKVMRWTQARVVKETMTVSVILVENYLDAAQCVNGFSRSSLIVFIGFKRGRAAFVRSYVGFTAACQANDRPSVDLSLPSAEMISWHPINLRPPSVKLPSQIETTTTLDAGVTLKCRPMKNPPGEK